MRSFKSASFFSEMVNPFLEIVIPKNSNPFRNSVMIGGFSFNPK